jgi:TonB-linked SusC/RagA family outer membrane protein
MNKIFTRKALLLWLFVMFGALSAWAQGRTISGTVSSFTENEPLPGVAIRVKGTSTGTVTDLDGRYQLQVSSNDAVLVFSFVGYNTQEETVGNRSTIDVKLAEDIETLGEVVVVGYGVQEKREVTGSIARVDGGKIAEMPTPSFEAALQGRAAGVQVIQGSGLAGSGSVIKVRGTSAISASGDPLYVVDGIPIIQDNFLGGNRGAMNQNPLATINPEDIESVEILKDAGAAAIYGSRGANGVILVTTKRGKSKKGTLSFSTDHGFSAPAIKQDFLNTAELIQLRQEAWENDGNTGPVWLPNLTGPESTSEERALAIEEALQTNTDWWDETTRTGYLQEYNLSYSKANEYLSAFVSGSYSDNQSFLKGNSYERLSGRVNLDAKLAKNFKATLSSSISRGINNRVDAAWSGGLGQAMSTSLPYYPIYNEDGTFYTIQNPVRTRELLDWRVRDLRTINNLTLTYTPIKNLNVRAVGGYDYLDSNDDTFSPSELNGTANNNANRYKVWTENYTLSLQADYLLELENSKLTLLAGTEYQDKTNNFRDYAIVGIENPIYDDEGVDLNLNSQRVDITRFFSYFGRATYTIKDRYVLQGIGRVDASSTFGPENQYGFFPSLSAAWILSEEGFMQNVEQISMLKLRGSYGLIGTPPGATNQYRGTYITEGNNPYQGNDVIYPSKLASPQLKWQTTYNTDLGLEFGLFGNRITGELAYYNRLTQDVLVNRANPPSNGFASYWDNIGEIRNRGIEFEFSSKNLVGDFTWTTNFNIANNNNEVLSLGDLTPDAAGGGTNDTRVAVGYPVGANYLVRFAGVDPTDGLPIWLDAQGYETKQFSLDHRVIVGDVLPDFTGGITNSFTYGGFDLSFLFTFTQGGNIYDGSAKRQLGKVTDWNMRSEIADRWTGPGDTDAKFPRLTLQNYPGLPDEWQYNSTLFLHDASYLRLRNLSVGYNLPATLASKIRASTARVSLSAMNLLTFTKYPGDPEIARDFENLQDRNMSPNVTYLTTPQQRSITLGVNVTF